MTGAFDHIQRAFGQLPQRPAVFDCEARQAAGRWWLADPVDVRDVISSLVDHGGFDETPSRVRVPLHEPDSAELTGEYLLYLDDDPAPAVLFYDFSIEGFRRLPLAEFGRTYPARRVRFWSAGTNPEDVPTYLDDGTPAGSTTSSPDGLLDAVGVASGGTTENTGEDGGDRGEQFTALREFVEREREAARQATRDAYESMRRRAFFANNEGVQGLVAGGRRTDDYGQQVVTLRVPAAGDAGMAAESAVTEADGAGTAAEGAGVDAAGTDGADPSSELYSGMEVLADRTDDGTGFPVEAELFAVDGEKLEMGVYWDTADDKAAAERAFKAESGGEFAVCALVNPVPFDRQLDAIDAVESDERKRAIVTGERALSAEEKSYNHLGSDLNASQATAARRVLRANDVFCIHGPPGTGKTRTLTAIIRAAVDEGLRVLAAAHSNQAVDTLLVGDSTDARADPRSIHADAVDGDVRIARVGRNSTNDVVTDHYVDGDEWQADVVGATMSAASELADDMFDVAVIDEATQATIPSTLIPVSKAETSILAGDHRQLPPYHSGDGKHVEELEFSLFERLLETYGPAEVSTTLTTQYRMHEAIAAFPNEAFYDGVLTHGQRNRQWTIGSMDPLVAVAVDGEESQTPMYSYINGAEARTVANEVKRLLEHGVMATDIGVITPYNGQIGKIRSVLQSDLGEAVTSGVKVDTIDSFQGGQRDAIVVSFVRSNPDGEVGFLGLPTEGPRRLNVALTRAKKRLVLVGNWDTLTAGGDDPESPKRYYRDLYEHLRTTDCFRE
ncbi:AAA domain-containing protein [Haloparvum sp. PAK95]|uniref:AAA domain-containing protein n=1 Tax=Haloparvum sp. PAK95 TaxID=3418962 RepID=UPI003D2EC973